MEFKGELRMPMEKGDNFRDTIKKLTNVPEEIIREILDIYNYMAENMTRTTIIKFEDGTRFEMRIRTSKDSAGEQA